ncbi:hypothetical protein EOL96_04105 [Candidatus Saccharibacteria bacterium]|nr:hypothetical protein [Candidatus Saccharibacteria bacterium]
MKTIEDRLIAIEERNSKVEADKAWETSWTRRISIMILTYVVVALYFAIVVGVEPWLNALVPVVGFLLSTLAVSTVKEYWMKKRGSK